MSSPDARPLPDGDHTRPLPDEISGPPLPAGDRVDLDAGPLPDGFRIGLDPGVRSIGDGSVLVGGSPLRLLRLTPSGRDLVDRLVAGEPVPRSPAAQSLTRRLLDGGLAHPQPPASTSPSDVAIVIPVRNDANGLAATLAASSTSSDVGTRPAPVVVVDDASAELGPLAAACTPTGATLIRRTAQGGPAAARNEGWRATTRDFVAFVDANCEPEPGWLDLLLPHFADPQVAAVAPRVVPPAVPAPAVRGPNWNRWWLGVQKGVPITTGCSWAPAAPAARPRSAPRWLAAYEAVCSPLDLGPREAIVRPRSPVAYVPTAALVVRRTALEALDGFDETLTVGEDVDFVWRLVAAGWTVRYEPRAAVRHPIRPRWSAWLRQRYRYGTSAAPLARRHGTAVAPLVVSPWTAAAWALVAAGQPALGVAAAGYPVVALAARPSHQEPASPPHAAPVRPQDGEPVRQPEREPVRPPEREPVRPPEREPVRPPEREPVGPTHGAARLRLPDAARLTGLGHLRGGLALARALRRAWSPAAVLLAVASRRSRPALAAAVVVPGLLDWLDRRPRLDPARFLALRLADDLAYAAGVWAGCARERSVRALLPDLGGAPRRSVSQTDEPLSRPIGGGS